MGSGVAALVHLIESCMMKQLLTMWVFSDETIAAMLADLQRFSQGDVEQLQDYEQEELGEVKSLVEEEMKRR